MALIATSSLRSTKRISAICKRCRSATEIRQAFDQLQRDLDEQISTTLQEGRTKLLENFDGDVHHKLRLRQKETQQRLDRHEDWLWALTATELAGQADFDFAKHRFSLRSPPVQERRFDRFLCARLAIYGVKFRSGECCESHLSGDGHRSMGTSSIVAEA